MAPGAEVGIMLGNNGTALGGIDLDTCRAADGTAEPWALAVITRFGSYAELSPSGTGIKIFFRYDPADLPGLRAMMGTAYGKQWKRPGNGHPPAIELYLDRRYFAVTAEHFPSTPEALNLVQYETLQWLIEQAGPAFVGANKPTAARPGRAEAGNSSQLIADRVAAAAASYPCLRRRWAGDWSGLSDASGSGKAMALGSALKRAGFGFDDMCGALNTHPDTRDWAAGKGEAGGRRELRRLWEKSEAAPADAKRPLFRPLPPAPEFPIVRLGRSAMRWKPCSCERRRRWQFARNPSWQPPRSQFRRTATWTCPARG